MQIDRKPIVIVLFVAALAVHPATASADAWFSPYVGTLFGGSAGDLADAVEAVDNAKDLTYGFSFGGMGGGVFGAEFDFGYTPHYYGSDSAVDSSNLLTLQGSLLIGIPVGGQSGAGLRPYGVVGLGMIRREIEFDRFFDDVSSSEFGYNLGFGLMGFFNDVFGLRGEYRYFRNFQEDDDIFSLSRGTFDVSRASVGVVLRF